MTISKTNYSRRRYFFLCLALTVFAAPAVAEDLAARLYKESGMQTQLESMSGAFDQGFNRVATDMPKETMNDLIQIGQDSFNEPTMAKIIIAHLNDKMTKDEMKKVLDWQSGKTAQKITRLENEAASPEGQKKLMTYAQQLATKQPSKSYMEQIQQLAVASKSVDLAVEIASNMQYSMGAGMAMANAEGKPVDLDALAAQINQVKPQLQQQIAQYIMVSMLYTYQELSEQELKDYIAFVSSPVGNSYYAAMFGGIDKAFIKVGKEYGKALGEYFGKQSKQSKS